jgi:fumarate reductase flavoprotein subunit
VNITAADVVVVGGGGAGIRAAIEIASSNPQLKIALVSKVYPMRSHTVAAEGGAAGVRSADDSFQAHFQDTVSGGDWLCDQQVVEFFVERAPSELARLERWGCPWSRQSDGEVDIRKFGGMSQARTWFAADKTGFHILHTLFQTSMKFEQIVRFDEHFVLEILTDNGQATGVLAYDQRNGVPVYIQVKAVILATGGAARVFSQNTNATIVTGEGIAMAWRAGATLRDMEFVQYHPTGLPGSGILISEACRGEGGVLLNAAGERYLADYGLGPVTELGHPVAKHMELGPRDRLSQAFWHEQRAGRTIPTADGEVVLLDLRHLGRQKLKERLPLIYDLAENFMGIDPAITPIPVAPSAHYTMGGVRTDSTTATSVGGLFAVGEAASSGLHGANRLGSNSLAELLVFGREAGVRASEFAIGTSTITNIAKARHLAEQYLRLRGQGTQSAAQIRSELGQTMSICMGIYRDEQGLLTAATKLGELQQRYLHVKVTDTCPVYNTEWAAAIELGGMLDVAEAMVASAYLRRESRGAHQRLDFPTRDDANYLKHSLYLPTREVAYEPVNITSSPPGERVYGAATSGGPK